MILLARILLILFLTAAALFCLFGLAATFEPLPSATQWTWRGLYIAGLAISFIAIVLVWASRPSKPS